MSCLSSKERRTYHSSNRPGKVTWKMGSIPPCSRLQTKKTATPDWLSTWRLSEHYSTIFNILTDKMHLFRRELKYRLSGTTALLELGTIEGSFLIKETTKGNQGNARRSFVISASLDNPCWPRSPAEVGQLTQWLISEKKIRCSQMRHHRHHNHLPGKKQTRFN